MTTLPFQPIRTDLYSPEELLQGLDFSNPSSLESIPDLRIYQFFVTEGRGETTSPFTSMMEALHDNFINQARADFQTRWDKIVGIAGDHNMDRGTQTYRQVSALARSLAQHQVLIVTGGGPGAMEAAHVGATFQNSPDSDFEAALNRLAAVPSLPDGLNKLVSSRGIFDPAVRDALHAWWLPAIQIHRDLGSFASPSLALPTWYYGHEAFTPFATAIAKYFQNSIREDGLVTICTAGVVYTEGGAGTVQEIFQDAEQNYYRTVQNRFSPMVFLGSEYWQQKLPVIPLLQSLFGMDHFAKYVFITDSRQKATDFLLGFTS